MEIGLATGTVLSTAGGKFRNGGEEKNGLGRRPKRIGAKEERKDFSQWSGVLEGWEVVGAFGTCSPDWG